MKMFVVVAYIRYFSCQSTYHHPAFLLLVINLLIALVQLDSVTITAPAIVVLIHILVIGPILCITVWFGCVFITKCGVFDYFCNTFIKRRQPITTDSIQHANPPTQQKIYYKMVKESP